MLWLACFDKVVGLAVVVVVHPPNLGLIKEGFGKKHFGREGQPVNKEVTNKKQISSQSLCFELTA
jgi:hypothetical protein